MAKPLDARAQRTTEALQSSLLNLLKDKPMDQITVRDIVAQAGINYATFFRHHASKESLLEHLASDEIQRLVDLTLPVLDSANMAAANHALFSYVQENRQLWTALLTGGAAGIMREEQLRLSRAVAADRYNGESKVPLELLVNCSVSLIFETLVWWLARPLEQCSIEEATEILTSLMQSQSLFDWTEK